MLIGLFLFNRIHDKASIEEVSFLLLLSCLINTHTYGGLFETFKWMKTTTDSKLFIAFLIYKNLFVPLILTCFVLLIDTSIKNLKILYFLFFIFIILFIDVINLSSGLYSFKTWNLAYTFIYYGILLLFLLFALKWFRGLKLRTEGEKNAVD